MSAANLKLLVGALHTTGPGPHATAMPPAFDYQNPNAQPPTTPPVHGPPRVYDRVEEVAAARLRHSDEVSRRLRWCLDNNLWPAHDHVHQAPGDDGEFMFGVAPWHSDGTVNPPGVPCSVPPAVDKSRLIADYDSRSGWSCTKCGGWVNVRPREAEGKEPRDWWWCKACKASSQGASRKRASQDKPLGGGLIESFFDRSIKCPKEEC